MTNNSGSLNLTGGFQASDSIIPSFFSSDSDRLK